VSCTPGATATFSCNGGSATEPAVVRVCEGSGKLGAIPCLYREALASETLVGTAVDVTFTCPEARDADAGETGGLVGVFTAPLLEGDETDVTCTLK
jgi:hypothetical protein